MERQTKSNRWILFVGIGCVVILCICGALVAGFFLITRSNSSTTFINDFPNFIPDEILPEINTPEPLSIEIPTLPAIELPTMPAIDELLPTLQALGTGPDQASGQYLDDSMLIDDFSTTAMEWPEYDDGLTILKYENQAYSFQIKEPDYYDWVYIPVLFNPSYIMFDVWGLPGEQDGTFGVFCQYQDPSNYYYVEFDLQTRQAVIAKIEDDEFIPLTEPDSNDEYWFPVNALKQSPDQVNTIAIDCQLGAITLLVNNEFVQMVPVNNPFSDPGVMAFFVFTFSSAGPEGYKVYFDNVIIR